MLPIRKILCSTDFSEPSFKGMAAADELAAHFGAELILVTVVIPLPPAVSAEIPAGHLAEEFFKDMVNHATTSLAKVEAERITKGVKTQRFVAFGNAAEEIIALSQQQNVDLLVIATHGWTGWRRLIFGSVAERVIRLATCPVLTITGPAAP
jgi:nucleotide-binding universal stress UspA family protein